MSDALGPLTDQLVGRRDAHTGSILLTGWAAGPAGLATVRLGAGDVELSVDYAEPSTVSQVVVAPDTERTAPVGAALDRLLAGGWHDLASGLTTDPRVVWHHPDRGLARIGRPGIVSDLGRLAIIEAEANERRLSPAGSAIADIERALLVAGLPADLHLVPTAPDLLRRAGTALLDLALAELQGRLDWRTQMELAALLTRAIDTIDHGDDGFGDHLGGLASRLRDGKPMTAMPAAASMAPSAPSALSALSARAMPEPERFGRLAEHAVDHLSRDFGRRPPPPTVEVEVDPALDVEVMHSTLADGHLEVAIRGAAPTDLWLRLFRTDARPVLLAMGPTRRNDFGSSSATVLVPSDVPIEHLVADITDTPGRRFVAPTVRTTQRAVRRGRDACRAERDLDAGIGAASDAWQRCATDWHAVGDDRRAALAERYAEGLAVADAPRGTVAYRGGRDQREPLAPFLTDAVEGS